MRKEIIKSKRINTSPFIYGIVRKIGSNEVVEVQRMDIKTKEKKIVFQDKNYKKLLDKIKLEKRSN